MKLCSMKLENRVKIDPVALFKTLYYETLLFGVNFHETQFWIEHVLFHTTCLMKLFPIYQCLSDMTNKNPGQMVIADVFML